MPAAKKSNFLRDNVALVSSMVPVLAIIIAGFSYVFSMAQNVSTSKKEIQVIQEQLSKASRLLEVNNYGESEIENRINSVEYHIYEVQEDQILDIITRLLLIDESLKDIRDTQNGTAHYLYTMQEGPQKKLAEHIIEITQLKSDVDNILSAHVWYNSYLSLLDAQLLEIGIRVQPPQDTFSGGGYGNYR